MDPNLGFGVYKGYVWVSGSTLNPMTYKKHHQVWGGVPSNNNPPFLPCRTGARERETEVGDLGFHVRAAYTPRLSCRSYSVLLIDFIPQLQRELTLGL